ncbi:MAG: hypothetical protein AB1629_05715 [Candidatus Omnitrophota bacterium]
MRKITLIIIFLVLSASFGYCQDQSLQLTIKSDKEVYEVGEEVGFQLTIKNVSSEEIEAPELIWSSKVIIDGKEYSLDSKYIGIWNGPGIILAGTEMFSSIVLSRYGITKDVLTLGKHDISVKIGNAFSNTIQIEVREKNP